MVLPSAVTLDVMACNCFGGQASKVILVGCMGFSTFVERLRERGDEFGSSLSVGGTEKRFHVIYLALFLWDTLNLYLSDLLTSA